MSRFKEERIHDEVKFLKKGGASAAFYYFAHEEKTGEIWLAKGFMYDKQGIIAPSLQAVMSDIYREILGNRLYAYFGIPVARLETQEMPAHFLEGNYWKVVCDELGHKKLPALLSRYLDHYHDHGKNTYQYLVTPQKTELCCLTIEDETFMEVGLGRILAVAQFLNDPDVVGTGGNVGYRFRQHPDTGRLIIESCKIDPGNVFHRFESDKTNAVNPKIALANPDYKEEEEEDDQEDNRTEWKRWPIQTQSEYWETVELIINTSPEKLEEVFQSVDPDKQFLDYAICLERLIERQKSLQGIWAQYQDSVQNKPKPVIKLPPLTINQLKDPIERLKMHHQWVLSKTIVQQSLHYYIPPYVVNEPGQAVDPDKPFQFMLERFLTDPNEKVLLLLGPAGAGKSIETYRILDEVLKGEQLVPIRIELKRFTSNTVGHCVINILKDDYQLSERQIEELKLKNSLIILDGYDEIGGGANGINLYDSNELSTWENSKVIITCRTQYYNYDMKQNCFAPGKELLHLRTWHLAPLDKGQIKAYIQKQTDFDVQSCLGYIESQSKLEDLFNTPLVLRILVEAWPKLQKNLNERLTRFDLYEAFFNLWEEREEMKWVQTLGEVGLKTEQGEKYGKLVDLFKAFSERLALALYAYPGEEQQYDPEVDSIWQGFFCDTDSKIVKMRAGCPLVRKNNIYEFLHKSFGEHLVARQLWRAVRESNWNEIMILWSLQYLVEERLILEILVDQLKSLSKDSMEVNRLFDVIEKSKGDPKFGVAASNAMTLLNKAGVQFSRKNFEGAHIPKADLSDGRFIGTNFSKAHLLEVNFQNSDLRECNLSCSLLTGVKFGERPFLKFKKPIGSCVFSQDGHYLAIAVDLYIKLYEALTGRELKTFKGHKSSVTSIYFSPNGKWLISGSWDKTCRLWEVKTGKCKHIFEGHTDAVMGVQFSADGKSFVSRGSKPTCLVWDIEKRECHEIFEAREFDIIESVYLSSDGKWLVCGVDRTCQLWEVKSRKCKQVFKGHTGNISSVCLSLDGKCLVSGSSDGTCRLWKVESGECKHIFEGHTSTITSIHLSFDGKWLLSGSSDKTCRLWEMKTGKCKQIFEGHTQEVKSVYFSSDGKWFVSGSHDSTCRQWEVETREFWQVKENTNMEIIHLSSNGKWLVSRGGETCQLWEVGTQVCKQVFKVHPNDITASHLSMDGKLLIFGNSDYSCQLWEVATGKCKQVFKGHTEKVFSIDLSSDGKWLVTGGGDYTCRLWEVETGKCKKVFKGHTNDVHSIHFSLDGKWFVSGSDDWCRLWDVEAEEFKHLFRHLSIFSKSGVISIRLSSNGKWLITGAWNWDYTCLLWEVETGKCKQHFKGHKGPVISVHFSSDGKYLVSASTDKTCRLWDIETGDCIQVIQIPDDICYVALTPLDNQLIIATSKNILQRFMQGKDGLYHCVWISSSLNLLLLSDCQAEGARGLSEVNHTLLNQRGAKTSSYNAYFSLQHDLQAELQTYEVIRHELKTKLFKLPLSESHTEKLLYFSQMIENYFHLYEKKKTPSTSVSGRKYSTFWNSRFFKGFGTLSHTKLYAFLKSKEDFTAKDMVHFFEGLKIYSPRVKESYKAFTKEEANKCLLQKLASKLQSLFDSNDIAGLLEFYLKVNPYLISVHQAVFETYILKILKTIEDDLFFEVQIKLLPDIINKPYELCSKETILIFLCMMERFYPTQLALELKKIETLLAFMVQSGQLELKDDKYEQLLPALSAWIKNTHQVFEKLCLQENMEDYWDKNSEEWQQLAELQHQAQLVINTMTADKEIQLNTYYPISIR